MQMTRHIRSRRFELNPYINHDQDLAGKEHADEFLSATGLRFLQEAREQSNERFLVKSPSQGNNQCRSVWIASGIGRQLGNQFWIMSGLKQVKWMTTPGPEEARASFGKKQRRCTLSWAQSSRSSFAVCMVNS